LTPGATYFLSPTTPGALTTTEPTALGDVTKPVLRVLTELTPGGVTPAIFLSMRGAVISA